MVFRGRLTGICHATHPIVRILPEESLIRQTPGCSGRWQEFEYVTQAAGHPVDGWVVYDNLTRPMVERCPPDNTLLITGEPESVRRYRARFTSQFGQIWSSHPSIHHPRVTYRNEAQHWHYAMRIGSAHGKQLTFDELQRLPRPRKTKLLSVICSAKAQTADHRKRLEFVRLLEARLGESIDIFGRGIRTMADKSEAIYDYKYHIVLENDHSEYFMTEKISDAFLGWSYPIYFGGPEAYHRFPEGSFTAINIYKPEEALTIIRSTLSGSTYENRLSHISAAREAVLFKNNLFAMLTEYWQQNLQSTSTQSVKLLPKNMRAELMMRQIGRSMVKPFTRRVA